MSRRVSLATVALLGWLLVLPTRAAEVVWEGSASPSCRIALELVDGPIEIVRGAAAPRLLGPAGRLSISAETRDGDSKLNVRRSPGPDAAGSGLILEAPAACRLDVATQTGDVTLRVEEGADLRVELATSGEITVDFSVAIDYHRHEEPAKRGTITIGAGTVAARLTSRQGAIRVLRSRSGSSPPQVAQEVE